MSLKPVLNLQTTYTALMHPSASEYTAYGRTCSDGDTPVGKKCKIW